MVSGAIVNWLALFRRPMCGNLSFLCTLAAVAVLLGHVGFHLRCEILVFL